jgi:hypothetical protein
MYMLHVYEISNLDKGIGGVLVSVLASSAVDPGFAISLKQQSADRHVGPLGHIMLIPSQRVFVRSP